MTTILTVLALIVLVAGSIVMLVIFLASPPDPAGPDDAIEGMLLAVQLVWPVVVVAASALGGAAFLLDGRPNQAVVLVIGAGAAYIAVRAVVPSLLTLNNNHLPLRGLPATLCCLLFAGLNAIAVYSAWRFFL